MDLLTILKWIAALGTVATGLLGLVKPTSIYGFTGLQATGSRGLTEIRAIFGGLFIALGLAPFFLGGPAFRMLGYGYLGIAAARLVAFPLDRSRETSNLVSLAIELVFGLLLVWSA